MIKLKDIFNIDLSTRGGAKLFDKIANKYNLIKSDRKDLVEVVNKGGSSSSDMKYYKINATGIQYDLVALYKIKTRTGFDILGNNPENDRDIVAIAYAPIANEGVIYYSLKDYYKSQLPDMSDEEFEYQFAQLLTPITKEEFYDLNNI